MYLSYQQHMHKIPLPLSFSFLSNNNFFQENWLKICKQQQNNFISNNASKLTDTKIVNLYDNLLYSKWHFVSSRQWWTYCSFALGFVCGSWHSIMTSWSVDSLSGLALVVCCHIGFDPTKESQYVPIDSLILPNSDE